VALTGAQAYCYSTADQHPERGGGFGMFAEYDHRVVRITRLDAGGPTIIAIPESLQGAASRMTLRPTSQRLTFFLTEVATALDADVPLRAEVLRARFESSGPAMRLDRLAEAQWTP
jgi:hypothetical protein